MNSRRTLVASAVVSLALLHPAASAQSTPPPAPDFSPTVGQMGKDVIWVPTHQSLVDYMLDLVKLTPQDYLVDLGSGDGRTVITAAQRGAKAHGIEFNPDMVALSLRNAKAAGVSDRATFAQGDIFESDFSDATVLTLFLLPNLNLKLRPTILNMAPGTRVVSNSFDMGDWTPDFTGDAKSNCPNYCTVHMWVVPAKVQGAWKLADGSVELTQTFQMLSGSLTQAGGAMPVTDGRMDGTQITFSVQGKRYSGTVNGKEIKGMIDGTTPWTATRSG